MADIFMMHAALVFFEVLISVPIALFIAAFLLALLDFLHGSMFPAPVAALTDEAQ